MTKTKTNNFKDKKKLKLNWRLLNLFCLILLCSMGACYVFGVNDLSIKGFVLYEDKLRVNELKEQNKQLELRIMAMESNVQLNERAANMKLVVADKIEYLKIPDEMVAVK